MTTQINEMETKMKRANGTGTIVERKDKRRRNPFLARIWNGSKQVSIGSFPTYDLALAKLAEYTLDPSSLAKSRITFKDVFNALIKDRETKVSKSTLASYNTSLRYCAPIIDKPIITLKILDYQQVINGIIKDGIGKASQVKCKQMFSAIIKQAIKMDILPSSTNIIKFIELGKDTVDNKVEKTIFTTAQLKKLREVSKSKHDLAYFANYVLMLCYSGCRPTEFINVKTSDVNIKDGYFRIGESKTEASSNRIIPIHKSILTYVKKLVKAGKEFLVTKLDGTQFSYHQFRDIFAELMKHIGCKHTPHECRHTCASMLNSAGVNDVAIKRILGHTSGDITKDVYTHKTTKELIAAINCI